jgi:hypothetical protein
LKKELSLCIKISVLFIAISAQVNYANELSAPLQMAIESCNDNSSKEERFACSLMMHDMLCYNSVMQTALSLNDDRHKCLSDQENPIINQYLKDALKEINQDESLKKQLHSAYKQWQYNITNMQPQHLEPEYQFKLRRDKNNQALIFKLIPIQQRHFH